MSRLYYELAPWWPLLSAPADYETAASFFWGVLSRHARRPIGTVLELGCGGGNNASFFKRHAQLTLTDLSGAMLEVSRGLNPECEHVRGDMRGMRLGRVFDAVFVHDAVMYMTSLDDLRRAVETASVHCAPGGVVLFVPDAIRETWREQTERGGHDGVGRSLRYLQWDWDPDPSDTSYRVEMAYMLREGEDVRVEHESHTLGLFGEREWLGLLAETGLTGAVEGCAFPGGETARVFVGVRGA